MHDPKFWKKAYTGKISFGEIDYYNIFYFRYIDKFIAGKPAITQFQYPSTSEDGFAYNLFNYAKDDELRAKFFGKDGDGFIAERSLEDIPKEVKGELIREMDVDEFERIKERLERYRNG